MVTAFDEMRAEGDRIRDWIRHPESMARIPSGRSIALRRQQAELFFRRIGITFAVYGDAARRPNGLIPFEHHPPGDDQAGNGRVLEKGLTQRVNALNAFLADIYVQHLALAYIYDVQRRLHVC